MRVGADNRPGSGASSTRFQQGLRRKWLRMVRLWEREGTWAVLRGMAVKSGRAIQALFVRKVVPGLRRVTRMGRGDAANQSGASDEALSPHARWMAAHAPGQEELARQRQSAETFAYRPLISLICPVYNPPPETLREALESVAAQTYGNWQLCLADGSVDKPEVAAVLAEFADRDPRIQVRRLVQNLGISGNSNAALALAEGEFVALFDHDDRLAPSLLYEVAALLNANPQADIVYFDEDHIEADSSQGAWSFFKPDRWSPELLLSTNYLMHSVVRKALVEQVGDFDPDFDGAQDWDLLFRCSEKTDRIVHIPKVLYHWRQLSSSASRKATIAERQIRCVESHLGRLGLPAPQAHFTPEGALRVSWTTRQPKVSIIIPTKDKLKYLRRCLDSLLRLTTYPHYEIILMDTGSTNKQTLRYYETLRKEPRVRLVQDSAPFNYSRVNNEGVKQASGEVLLFLNNDVEILEGDWLEEMVRWAERSEIGAVGAKLLYRDGTIQHAGVILGMQGFASHLFWDAPEDACGTYGCVGWYRNYLAVTGACLMLRREVFEAVGGFDESYLLAFSDVELCLRVVGAGYRVVYTPFARLIHYEGRSRADHIPKNDLVVAYKHLRAVVEAGDPYFNPNLSYFSRMPVAAPLQEETRIHYLDRMMRFFKVLDDPGTVEAR